MASRYSHFHTSLHRPRLVMGVESAYFSALALTFAIVLGTRMYVLLLGLLVLYLVGRWLSKKDALFVKVLARYLYEEHVYDATPRRDDFKNRPAGWGQGIPR